MESGDTKGARELLDHALSAASSRLGARHPITTTAAWNLFLLLKNNKAESATVVKLVENYLAWLLQANPSALGDEQCNVRAQFAQTRDGMFQMMEMRLFGSAQA